MGRHKIQTSLRKMLGSMFNKVYFITIISTLFLFLSCSHSAKNRVTKPLTDIEIGQNEISLKGDSSQNYMLTVTIGDDIKFENPLMGNQTIGYLELLKTKPDLYNKIAYHLAINKGNIKIGLNIHNICDTTIYYRYNVANTYDLTGNVIEGICAPLHGAYSQVNIETDIIKWLYRNGYNNIADSTINDIRLYIQDLSRSKFKQYQTKDEVPVIASLKGIDYRISSDMKADYYYLLACQNENQIDDFVEEVVSLKFEGAENSLNEPILCYRSPSTNGLACIMLIGINSNWSYKVVPIGLISIDNISPTVGKMIDEDKSFSSSQFLFKNHQIEVNSKSPVPIISGHLNINLGKFQGYGYMLNVPFTFSFHGDISKIIVHRTKNLTENIDLSDKKSPYHITLNIGLDTGDNYIPIEVIDKRGNRTSYDLKITTEQIKDNPVIENNIYN